MDRQLKDRYRENEILFMTGKIVHVSIDFFQFDKNLCPV